MHLTVYHLWTVLQEQSKTAIKIFSRALTTRKSHGNRDTVKDFSRCGVQAFPGNRKPEISKLLIHLQEHGSGSSSLTPNVLSKTISSCAKSGLLEMGIQIHAVVIKLGFCLNVYICSALVDMYGKVDILPDAQKVFDEMPNRNVVTWNSLISGYLLVGCPQISIGLFLEMLKAGIAPTPFSLSGVLAGCSQLEDRKLGTQLHGLSLKASFWPNVVIGTGLIDMYSKCCEIEEGRFVFDRMPDKNVVTWTSMVTGYAQNQHPEEAMTLVREMLRLHLKPNHVTYNSLLSSFSCPSYLDHCRLIHCRIIQEGLEINDYIAVTLVTVYSECGCNLEDFQKICSSVMRLDPISWNAIIAGFSNLGIGEEAIKCFIEMKRVGFDVDIYTITSTFRAIGVISALEEGKQFHGLVSKTGHSLNLRVQNGIVSMYAKCGAITDSERMFLTMKEHDSISWNSLISGCAYHGFGIRAIEFFEQMRRTGLQPDNTTFLAVLTACSHVGLVEKGLEYFNLMRNGDFLESPKVEHYATIVDLFGRADNLKDAEAFIENMPIDPGPSVYKALLSACQVHGNKEIATRTAKKLLEMYPDDPATYVLLSNLLMNEGYWDNAAGVRRLMMDRGVRKTPGFSWI